VAVGLVAVGSSWGLRSHRAETTRYRTAAAERGPIEAIVSATGTLQPVEQVEVGSQVSGTVQKLLAGYNSRVAAGQVLCQLDPSSFGARTVQAEAAVASAEAAVHDADRTLRRAHDLRDQNSISELELEAAEVAKQQRSADLQSARAQLQVARVDLEHTTIRSPIDGVVMSRTIDLGQIVAGLPAPKLFVIARSLAQMQVEARIDEADIGRIHPGLPVTFTVDAYPGTSFHGQVQQVRLEPITERGVVTYTTVIATQNPDQKLRPGMTANVSVMVARRENALKVPNAALGFRPAAPADTNRLVVAPGTAPAPDDSSSLVTGTVYVLRGGNPVAVPVLSGITDGAMTEVLARDLEPDDPVIIGYEPPPGSGGPLRGPGGRGVGGRP